MDRLTFALYVTVIGLVIVFVVLIILVFFTKVIPFANRIPSKENVKNKRKSGKPASQQMDKTEAPAAAAQPVSSVSDEDEIQAVIAAAIAAYMAQVPAAAVCPNGIVVRSIRRTGSFNAASRYERMNNRI